MLGVVLLLLGLAAGGVVVDYVVENPPASAPERAVQLLGRSFHLSQTELVIGTAVAAALAILLIVLGVGFLRGSWGRRRSLRRRVRELVDENAELRSKLHLAEIVRVEPAEGHPASTPQPSPEPSSEPSIVLPPAPEEAEPEHRPITRR